ncbi:hypothetical protein [Cohnella yongneupensis]|uniref:HTH cro/C1-type domain-containing protein n=1 Tax=Cohnella yongneupensis TaxID=425006 RepID=A0ABW0R7E9_9BACL
MQNKLFIKPNEITIRAARINAGLSPIDVKRETGIRPDRLELIELNCGKVTWKTAIKLARLYGRRLDDIYWGKEIDYHTMLNAQRSTSSSATPIGAAAG